MLLTTKCSLASGIYTQKIKQSFCSNNNPAFRGKVKHDGPYQQKNNIRRNENVWFKSIKKGNYPIWSIDIIYQKVEGS